CRGARRQRLARRRMANMSLSVTRCWRPLVFISDSGSGVPPSGGVGTPRCGVTGRVQRAELLQTTTSKVHVAPLNAARTAQRAVPTKPPVPACVQIAKGVEFLHANGAGH